MAAAAIGFIASITYTVLTGDGLFLASLRLILISMAFVILAPSAGVAAAIGGALSLMWVLAVASFYFALSQYAVLNCSKPCFKETYA